MVDSDSLRLLHMDGRFCKSLSPSLGSVGNSGLRAVDESIASRCPIQLSPLLQKPCVIQREGQPLPGAGEPSLPPTAMHCAALPAGGEVGGQEGRLGAPERSGLAVSTTDSTRTQAEGKGGHQPQTEEGKLLDGWSRGRGDGSVRSHTGHLTAHLC